MREVQGSVAATLDHQVHQTKEKKRVLIRQGISACEKLLYLFSVVVCVALASLSSPSMQRLPRQTYRSKGKKREVERLKEENRLFGDERRDLERGERIRKVAEEQGMIPKILHELPRIPEERDGGRG